MKTNIIRTIFLTLFCLSLMGCEVFKTDPNVVEIMQPASVSGGPATQTKGKDVEVTVIAWETDLKYDNVEKHYLKYFEEKGFKKFKRKPGYIFQSEVVECKLLPTDRGARAELRVAKILNGKPMPKPGILTTGI